MEPAVLTSYLHAHLPLTGAMGIQVLACTGEGVTLRAPLAPNLNHTDTAFGGSLSALGIVAGWALLHAALLDHQVSARLLIQRSAIDFIRPADADLTATCRFPDSAALGSFLEALQTRRRARLELTAAIYSAKTLAATNQGAYVALLY